MQITNKKHTIKINSKKLRKEKFAFNRKIREILFSHNTEIIGEGAFYDCRSLTKVTLSDFLKEIGADAFSLCEALEELVLPESLEKIGRNAFSWSGIKTVAIPSNIKKIEAYAFSNCKNLQKLTLNEGCTSIDNGAFADCMELKEIDIPESVTVLGDECFKGCTALKTIKLPDNIETLPESAFKNCLELETVILPDKLKVIEAECFSGCVNLKNIIIPSSLEVLGKKAFYRCEKLEKIHLFAKLSYLGDYSFAGCKNLSFLQIDGDLNYAGPAISGTCSVTHTGHAKNMFVTSFLNQTDYKLCPTIYIPENTKTLKLGFKDIMPYGYFVRNKSCYNHILCFKKYNAKVFISENYYSDNHYIINYGTFNFEAYDRLFDTADAFEKPIIAAFRLAYPVLISDEHRVMYQNELKQSAKDAAIFAVKTNEETTLKYLLDNTDFDTTFCEELHFMISELGHTNLLQVLSNKQIKTGFDEINSLLEGLI